ncbi:MAG: hypothetical protein CMN30_11500 [Sandaracinus sp.]|nr:hypothetical protein [Sandaracinus sp.]
MSEKTRTKRVLHFAVTSALVVAPAIGFGCGGGDAEEPHTNVAAGDEDPDTNVAAHVEGEPHTNVAADDEMAEPEVDVDDAAAADDAADSLADE